MYYSLIVPCCEEHGTQQEQYGEESMTASVTLRCAYADRHLLVAEIVGGRMRWPHFTLGQVPRARTASIKPFPSIGVSDFDAIVYEHALVTVQYITKSNEEEEDEDGEDVYSESFEPTAEFVTQDFKNFRWTNATGDALTDAEAPGKLRRGLNIVRTEFNKASIHEDVFERIGMVNASAVTSAALGRTFPAETLLYTPPRTDRTMRTDGTKGWNLTKSFMFKKEGWNKYWRAKTQSYERIWNVKDAALDYSYPLGSFTNIFPNT